LPCDGIYHSQSLTEIDRYNPICGDWNLTVLLHLLELLNLHVAKPFVWHDVSWLVSLTLLRYDVDGCELCELVWWHVYDVAYAHFVICVGVVF